MMRGIRSYCLLSALLFLPVGSAAWSKDEAKGPKPRKLEGHAGQVTSLAFSPDGRLLVSAGRDGYVHVWQWRTSKRLFRMLAHRGGAFSVAFSRDGKTLASAGADKRIRLWDPWTGKEKGQLLGHAGAVAAVSFSPDGKLLASGSYDRTVRLWDWAKGKELRKLLGHRDRVTSVSFSPDGKRLISGGASAQRVKSTLCGQSDYPLLWEVSSGKQLGMAKARGAEAAFSPDGNLAAVGGLISDIQTIKDGKNVGVAIGGFNKISLLEVATETVVFSIKWRGSVFAFSPDGRLLASGAGTDYYIPGCQIIGNGIDNAKMDFTLRLWEVGTHKEILKLPDKEHSVAIAFSPDGTTLATGNSATPPEFRRPQDPPDLSTVFLWDLVQAGQGEREGKASGPPPLEKMWSRLGEDNVPAAYQAVYTLVANPKKAVSMLQRKLRPITEVDGRTIRQMLLDLDSREFEVREKAARRLMELGLAVEPALRSWLPKAPSAEVRKRILSLLPAMRRAQPPVEERRRMRAIQVLEMIGTEDARRLLAELAKGTELANQTQMARQALERLARRKVR
jgi:WD40 repeat protein